MKIGDYIIARSASAGVFAGVLRSKPGKQVTLRNARRIWYWAGAASLSQLAQSGTSNPADCKFPEEVAEVVLTEVTEMLAVTSEARRSIKAVPIWRT